MSVALFQYPVVMCHSICPRNTFSREKIDFIGLLSCSHVFDICMYTFAFLCVLHLVHCVADERSCSWYALDSANSIATGLDRLPSVTHFLWLYKFGSLVNNHQKIRLMMLHIYVTPSILNYKAFQLS